MSVFRPTVRVRSPDGRDWEVYAFKLAVRDRGQWDPGLADAGPWRLLPELAALDAVLWVLGLVPRAVVRLGDACLAALRSVRSDDWTIEAICFVPRESFAWRTTREFKGQVLARVEGGLARGDVQTQLAHATFLGWQRPR